MNFQTFWKKLTFCTHFEFTNTHLFGFFSIQTHPNPPIAGHPLDMNVLFSTLSILILLPTVTTAGAGHPLKIRVYDNVFFHSAAVGPLPSSADLESSVCNMLQAQYNIDLSTCVQSLTAIIIKGRTAVQENLSPAGVRLGLGTVANCLYHNMTSSPCNAYYTHEALWEYTTLSGQTITKDEVLFLMVCENNRFVYYLWARFFVLLICLF